MATFLTSIVTVYAQNIEKTADFYGRPLGLKEPTVSAAGNQYAYIADPDGNWISVYQPMEQ